MKQNLIEEINRNKKLMGLLNETINPTFIRGLFANVRGPALRALESELGRILNTTVNLNNFRGAALDGLINRVGKKKFIEALISSSVKTEDEILRGLIGANLTNTQTSIRNFFTRNPQATVDDFLSIVRLQDDLPDDVAKRYVQHFKNQTQGAGQGAGRFADVDSLLDDLSREINNVTITPQEVEDFVDLIKSGKGKYRDLLVNIIHGQNKGISIERAKTMLDKGIDSLSDDLEGYVDNKEFINTLLQRVKALVRDNKELTDKVLRIGKKGMNQALKWTLIIAAAGLVVGGVAISSGKLFGTDDFGLKNILDFSLDHVGDPNQQGGGQQQGGGTQRPSRIRIN